MGVNVNPADLVAVADRYAELSRVARQAPARFVSQVGDVEASHGTMGYPVALGTLAAAAGAQPGLEELAERLSQYSQRFDDSASAYPDEDHTAAMTWRTGPFLEPEDVPGDDGEDEKSEEDRRAEAEHDVHQVLAGEATAEELARVRDGLKLSPAQLDAMTAGDEVQLTPIQMSYVSQMQAQQHGMKLSDLAKVDNQLGETGEYQNLIADSWQLMSNPNVAFDKTELVPGALDNPGDVVKGGFDQLPESVQHTMKPSDLSEIADIVQGGDSALQVNTDLDRSLLVRADDLTTFANRELFLADVSPDARPDRLTPWAYENAAEHVFQAVAPDHHAIHAAMNGAIDGLDNQKLLYNITHTAWPDGGAAAGKLFEWTHDAANSPEHKIAGETAKAVSSYLGDHGRELTHLYSLGAAGPTTLGQLNPELVRGLAHGLNPYVNNIAGTAGGSDDFDPHPDRGKIVSGGELGKAKNVFSVINTDPVAADEFNGAAYAESILHSKHFAEHPHPDHSPAELFDAYTLRGLIDVGIHNSIQSESDNDYENRLNEYQRKHTAYNVGVGILGAIPEAGPELAILGEALEGEIVGPPPRPGPELSMSNFDSTVADREMLSMLRALGNDVDLPEGYVVTTGLDPGASDGWRRLMAGDTTRIIDADEALDNGIEIGKYKETMNRAVCDALGFEFQDSYIYEIYNNLVKNPQLKDPE